MKPRKSLRCGHGRPWWQPCPGCALSIPPPIYWEMLRFVGEHRKHRRRPRKAGS